jgi:NACalpha-BTF3-like transcription factor
MSSHNYDIPQVQPTQQVSYDVPPPVQPPQQTRQQQEAGLRETDVRLVMAQTNASRAQAVAALLKWRGDIVDAIMELTAD